MLAKIPSLPYKTLIKITIITNPKNPAKRLFCKDELPRVGPTTCCSNTKRGTGSAPAVSCVLSSFADSKVNPPVITAFPFCMT